MKRLHIVGGKNQGKTKLTVDLVEEFTRRGLCVGTIKHTHHRHELDVPGKDSHQHRMAGAAVVGIVSPALSAVYLPIAAGTTDTDSYVKLAPMFGTCDLVLVEGDSQTSAPKIEVWRACLNTAPLAQKDAGVLAVISDDRIDVAQPVLPRSDVAGLAAWLLQQPWSPCRSSDVARVETSADG